MQTGQAHELITSGEKPEIVETVPGWTHDVTNIGSDEMIVMLWANEVFDRARLIRLLARCEGDQPNA